MDEEEECCGKVGEEDGAVAEKDGGEVVRRLEEEEGLGKELDKGEEKGAEKSGFDRVTAAATEKACIARGDMCGVALGVGVWFMVFASFVCCGTSAPPSSLLS